MDLVADYKAFRSEFASLHDFTDRSVYWRACAIWEREDETAITRILGKVDPLFWQWANADLIRRIEQDEEVENYLAEHGEYPRIKKDAEWDEEVEIEQYDAKERVHSVVAELFFLRNSEEVNADIKIDDAEWPRWFAAIALGYLASYIAEFKKALHPEHEMWRPGNVMTCASHLATAVEAINFAERLQETEREISERVRMHLSKRNAEAARKKHSPVANLKLEFARFAGQCPEVSKAEAARRFYRSLPKERRILSEQNFERTLVESLKATPASTRVS